MSHLRLRAIEQKLLSPSQACLPPLPEGGWLEAADLLLEQLQTQRCGGLILTTEARAAPMHG